MRKVIDILRGNRKDSDRGRRDLTWDDYALLAPLPWQRATHRKLGTVLYVPDTSYRGRMQKCKCHVRPPPKSQ